MEAIQAYFIIKWIKSCTKMIELETCVRLSERFKDTYGEHTPNSKRIQSALQLKRIDIAHLNAVGY